MNNLALNNKKHKKENIDLPIEFKDEYIPMIKKNIKHTDIND